MTAERRPPNFRFLVILHPFFFRSPTVSYFRSNVEAMAGYVPGEQPQTTSSSN